MAAAVHHVEIWVPDLSRAVTSWGWVLNRLGWKDGDGWPGGMRPGMNHLALNAASRAEVDTVVGEAADHGWTLMFADRHPYAGGPQHYAAFLHNTDGYELEIVAPD